MCFLKIFGEKKLEKRIKIRGNNFHKVFFS